MRFLDVRTGYISGYIRIHVSCTLHHDTSRFDIKIHRDTKSRYMYLGRVMVLASVVFESQVLQVNELVEMHGSCPRPLHRLCAPLKLWQGRHTYKEERTWDTGSWRIHAEYMRDTCGIHAGYMYLQRFEDTHAGYIHHKCKINQGYMRDKCICSGSRIHEGYMRDTSKIQIGIHVSQMYPERYVSEMQDTCGIHARYKYLQG